MAFYFLAGIAFLSAFLLFQIELIVAKLLLPAYGGSFLVWGACVVFFQGILLEGYLFAHHFISKKGIASYLKIHLFLLILPFLFFPGRMLQLPDTINGIPLVIDIFLKLLITIGLVFFVLSTISLVTQSWIVKSSNFKGNPYTLYAVSNFGSFLGLLSYPFFFELFFKNSEQLNLWRLFYLVLVGLNLASFKFIQLNRDRHEAQLKEKPDWSKAFSWLCLSAAGVVLFLSVTNIITYEITPAPLLWIFPLSIYLISFILNFKNKPFSPKWISTFIPLIILASIVYYFVSKMLSMPVVLSTIIFDILLLILCIFAQGELIRNKPKEGGLTFFYVMISLGGFLGGILTSWIIPLISINLVEFLVGLLLLSIGAKKKWLMVITTIAIIASPFIETAIKNHDSIAKKRNYYGIYDIYDRNELRVFVHGTTLHGVEFVDPAKQWIPIGYYSPTSPLGEVLTKDIFSIHRIGGIGLGAGTIAMYSRGDVTVDFYELDPDVIDLAKKHFGYLKLAPGQVNLFVGDARLSLKNQKNVKYDVLVVDAFGGDSVPTHLINNDVTALYKEHLNEGGAIVYHIPNRYFNLKPVLAHIAHSLGAYAAYKTIGDEGLTMRTVWGIITWDQQKYMRLITEHNWQPLDASSYPSLRPWSDDYSTILPIIEWLQLQASFQLLNKSHR